MKIHIFPWSDEYKKLEDVLVSKGFKVLRTDKGLDYDSLPIIVGESGIVSFKGKLRACFFIVSKKIDVSSVKDKVDKIFFYSMNESEEIFKLSDELDTELLVHDDFDELLEEVLIDVISVIQYY